MKDLSSSSVARVLAARDAERARREGAKRADEETTYVTADEERQDRMAAQRLAIVGLLHVGI